MGNQVIIAEKPSVARDIASVIGAKKREDGYLIGNGYIVTWAIGHLVGLANPDEYDPSLKEWKLETLPIIPEEMKLILNPKTKDQFKIVSNLINSKDTDSLVIATDAGREGELIARYILEKANCKKPFKRLWISSMTDEAIKEGFSKLKDGSNYDNLYHSAKCRSEADWLVGINSSRAYSINYNSQLSIGRVQTPTLAMIVNRNDLISNFKPQKYWTIEGTFNNEYNGTWFFDNETKIEDENKADAIIEEVRGKRGKVQDVINEDKSKANPLLYDLTELQRDGNKSYGLSAQEVLDIAQSLYEKHKLITYPRTDSRYLSDDMIPQLSEILSKISEAGIYNKHIQSILFNGDLPITTRIINNNKITDHHAIIPTNKVPRLENLNDNEKNIYDLVVKRFISAFLPKHEYMITKIITEIENHVFMTKGKTIKNMGWMELYYNSAIKEQDEEQEQELPKLNINDIVDLTKVVKLDKLTTPPKQYDEASLLSAMENAGRFIDDEELKEQLKKGGIGTPATRASIIERLISIGYIKREKKNLVPTDKGINLIKIVPDYLKSPEITGEWELELSNIAEGKKDFKEFMTRIKKMVHSTITESNAKKENVEFKQQEKPTKEIIGICPDCGSDVLESDKSFFCTGYKEGCKFSLWKEDKWFLRYKKKITKTVAKSLLKNKKAQIKGLYSEKKDANFDATIIMKKNGAYWNFEFDFNKK